MAKGEQDGLGDELFGTRLGELRDASGPTKVVERIEDMLKHEIHRKFI